jgi:phosphate transport system substrate-binding protein
MRPARAASDRGAGGNQMKEFRHFISPAVLMFGLFVSVLSGCPSSSGGGDESADMKSGGSQPAATGSSETLDISGKVTADGSSTVYPITEAVAEEFRSKAPNVQVTVGISGTGGGFKRFCAGETDLQNASRPIKPEEDAKAKEAGVEYIELPVAYDGLSVIVNPKNDFVDHLTVDELKAIWGPGSTIKNWKEVRKGFPDSPLHLFGPGTDSGTFDYFTEVINGKAKESRPDYTASEDDNVLVQGVAGDVGALGYFGFAYYEENADKLKLVPVDGGSGPVTPSKETVMDGTYKPLSRPLFVYVNVASLDKPEVKEFVQFYLTNAKELVSDVGYIPLPDAIYAAAAQRLASRTTGTVYTQGEGGGKSLAELYGVAGQNKS